MVHIRIIRWQLFSKGENSVFPSCLPPSIQERAMREFTRILLNLNPLRPASPVKVASVSRSHILTYQQISLIFLQTSKTKKNSMPSSFANIGVGFQDPDFIRRREYVRHILGGKQRVFLVLLIIYGRRCLEDVSIHELCSHPAQLPLEDPAKSSRRCHVYLQGLLND